MKNKKLKIAIVHDWLVTYAGAEKVLECIIELYPDADLYSLIEDLDEDNKDFLKNKKVNTTFMQKIPLIKKIYRKLLPIMPFAVETLDLGKYDLIISSSHAVAKGVITGPMQLHICYCHTPIRYAWDLESEYLYEAGLSQGIKYFLAKHLLKKIRMWDFISSSRVDYFISNSNFIGKRINKFYRKNSNTIYPPVDIDRFKNSFKKEDYYFTFSRFVSYKKIDLIAKTFSKYFPDKKLLIAGDGPDKNKIKSYENNNIKILGYLSQEELLKYLGGAKAFIFAAYEDFGIVNVEAQAAGTPVIAYGKGGGSETVIGIDKKNPTGLLFYEQNCESIRDAIIDFEDNIELFQQENMIKNANNFSKEVFKDSLSSFISSKVIGLKE